MSQAGGLEDRLLIPIAMAMATPTLAQEGIQLPVPKSWDVSLVLAAPAGRAARAPNLVFAALYLGMGR